MTCCLVALTTHFSKPSCMQKVQLDTGVLPTTHPTPHPNQTQANPAQTAKPFKAVSCAKQVPSKALQGKAPAKSLKAGSKRGPKQAQGGKRGPKWSKSESREARDRPQSRPKSTRSKGSLQFEAQCCAKRFLSKAWLQEAGTLQGAVPAKSPKECSKRGPKAAQKG